MGPQRVRDGRIELRQQKTGTPVAVPIHPLLAEAECSALLIQRITGHRSLRELEVYVRDVDQKRLADAAFAALRKSER